MKSLLILAIACILLGVKSQIDNCSESERNRSGCPKIYICAEKLTREEISFIEENKLLEKPSQVNISEPIPEQNMQLFSFQNQQEEKNQKKHKDLNADDKEEQDIIHIFNQNSNILYILSKEDESVIDTISLKKGKFEEKCETISIGRKIFSIGGLYHG